MGGESRVWAEEKRGLVVSPEGQEREGVPSERAQKGGAVRALYSPLLLDMAQRWT